MPFIDIKKKNIVIEYLESITFIVINSMEHTLEF